MLTIALPRANRLLPGWLVGCGLAVLLATALGCTAAQAPAPGGAAAPATLPAAGSGPLPLPAPSAIYGQQQRLKSASGLTHREAPDHLPGLSQRLTALDDDAIFTPAWAGPGSAFGDVAWAVYAFDLTSRHGLPEVHSVWKQAPGDYTRLWLGAANWQADRWDWYSGAPDGIAHTAGGGADVYRHPQTNAMYVAVVLLGEQAALLDYVYLAGFGAQGDWWQLGHDAAHTNRGLALGPAAPTLRFTFQLGQLGNISPPVYDVAGRLYVPGYNLAAAQLTLYCLEPDGTQVWAVTQQVPGGLDGPATLALDERGNVYLALPHGAVTAYNADGGYLWSFSGAKGIEYGPVLTFDGLIYVTGSAEAGNDGRLLYQLLPSGLAQWTFDCASRVTAPALGPDGALYAGTAEGRVLALSPAGSQLWEYWAGGPVTRNPALSLAGSLYFTTDEPRLYALDTSGAELWSASLPAACNGPLALDVDGTVFVPCADGRLYQYLPDGTPGWAYYAAGHTCSPILDAAGNVYVAGADGRLSALTPDGALRWFFPATERIFAPPVLAEDGTLYIVDNGGTLYAVGSGGQQPGYTASGLVLDNLNAGVPGVSIEVNGRPAVLTDATGSWRCEGLVDGAYLVHAALAGYNCTPLFQEFAVDGADTDVAHFLAAPAALQPWAMWGGDGAHRRRSAALGPAGPEVAWSVELEGQLRCEPVIGGDGGIHVYNSAGRLWALNPGGTVRWEHDLVCPTQANPALSLDGRVYLSSGAPVHSTISVYNAAGGFLWSHEFLDAPQGSPVPRADGSVVHKLGPSGLVALSAAGVELWRFAAGGETGGDSIPAVLPDGAVYFSNGVNKLYALHPDGSLFWSMNTPPHSENYPSTPGVSIAEDGTLYCNSGLALYAASPDGTQQWVYHPGGAFYTVPAIGADGALYTGSSNFNAEQYALLALEADGSVRWSYAAAEAVVAAPALDAAGCVYFATAGDGAVVALNLDGTLKWQCDAPDGMIAGPAIGADGMLYVGDNTGTLYAIGPGGS